MKEKIGVALQKKNAGIISYLEVLIPTFCIAQLLAGIIIHFTDTDIFEWYIKEDGYVESWTVIFLVLTAIIVFTKALTYQNKKIKYFYLFIGIVFLFGVGEEISWGQRILNFETPEELKALNTQNDLTVHNIKINEVKLNKLIFGAGLYLSVFSYFLLFPLLYHKSTTMRDLIDKLEFPVPAFRLSLLYFASFFCLMVISHHRVWELHELAITSFVFMAFLHNESVTSEKGKFK